MGVHGLTGFLKQLGIDHPDVSPTNLSQNSSTLAIDGNGLKYHLLRLAYYRHRSNVLSSKTPHDKALQSQLLLPSLIPLKLAHDVTTNYLSELTTRHGIHLKIYFDGSNQRMKKNQHELRKERRRNEWENVRQLCNIGILPSCVSKSRSSARKQAVEYKRQMSLETSGGVDSEAEMYLASFPVSYLVMEQIERSIRAFADMSPVLPCGSMQILQCEGEADSAVAKASADDTLGRTYALASDSDYIVYGYSNDEEQDNEESGQTQYLQFQQLDPSADDLSMIELAILMGNDYTGPLIKHDDVGKRKEYWESLQWCQEGDEECGDGERLPPQSTLDYMGIIEHVAEKVGDGLKLTSDNEELLLGIDFSYALYSFGDISDFPSSAPGSKDAEEIDDIDEPIFPSLPRDFISSLSQNGSTNAELVDATLFPLISYKSNLESENDELHYIESRHIDAARMTMEMMKHSDVIGPPKHKMNWSDLQSLYVMEKCLVEAMDDDSVLPYQVFEQSTFHSCLESISFSDGSLDNELVSKNEKAFMEEVTTQPALIQEEKKESDGPLLLPIDEHKEEILNAIKTQRVTIIQGETGCGKSSRVPCFILRAEPPEPTLAAPEVKMTISQPRHIAVKALSERVRSYERDLTDKIALRMGHGIKEHESSKTHAWFVTTGYLVRLLANYPGWFDSHTHLIIDEVHERSVDTDILCLLCRRLLKSHPTIRLILMSATMAAGLYTQYFGSPEPPIFVGVRRFPINEYFVEDLSDLLSLSRKQSNLAQQIYDACERNKCLSAPSVTDMEKLYKLATQITASVGNTGSSVLIFVPGMADIEAISELVEGLKVSNVVFKCFPIHSDVPFEEQMSIFEPPKQGEVKVIIGTNAAESSLTLPDVDHVICLGLRKQIMYNAASHRQILVPTWISRASATQRAGRTGRVRAGNVYRLYTRNTLNQYMQTFESGEMVRIPLDQVILSLRDMLDEAVTPILLESIEPPDITNIERSFRSLYESNFIGDPSDEGEITSLGSLAVSLGIDLTLGALIGLGIQFGVASEAIALAAVLSFPKTPWAISSPMYHDTATFNAITSKTFTSRCFFDAGLFSEPLAMINLVYDYANSNDRNKFIRDHCISSTRIRHLYGTLKSLKQRVAECLSIRTEVLDIENPPYKMHPAKLNILRIIQVWLFHDTIIVHKTAKKSKIECSSGELSIDLDGPPIDSSCLREILDKHRQPFQLTNTGKICHSVRFDPLTLLHNSGQYFECFDQRFASYALENNICFSMYTFSGSLKIFVCAETWEMDESRSPRDTIISKLSVKINEAIYFKTSSGSGNAGVIPEKACWAWHPCYSDSILTNSSGLLSRRVVVISCSKLGKSRTNEMKSLLELEVARNRSLNSALFCKITTTKKKAIGTIDVSGEHKKVSDIDDFRDMFEAPDLVATVSMSKVSQKISFPLAKESEGNGESKASPLFQDAPEGARLMAVLASERRKDHFIRFSNDVDVNLPKVLTINNGVKWKKKEGGGMVIVPVNCVPTAAIPTFTPKSIEIFGCCANSLELKGGARRVEGISLLPPGRLFVGIALLSFGFHPGTGLPYNIKQDGNDSSLLQEASDWIFVKEKALALEGEWRITDALEFNLSCMNLGEVLECQPDKIKALCELFNGICGDMHTWDGFDVTLKNASDDSMEKVFENVTNEDRPLEEFECMMENSRIEEHCLEPSGENRKVSYSETSEFSESKFACSNCNAIFSTWEKCVNHGKACCPEKKRWKKKKAITHASKITALATFSRKKPLENKMLIPLNHSDCRTIANDTIFSSSCEGCNERFIDKMEYMDHIEQCLSVNFHCTKCKDVFPTWSLFITHRTCCPGVSSM